VQDDIAHKVVTELAVTLSEGENERFMLRGTKNRKAWTLYRKGIAQFRKFKKAANLRARELSEKAIALDSKYSQAYSLLSWTYAWAVRYGLSSSPAKDLKKAVELANKASDLNSSNADAQNVLGFIYMVRGQYDKAIIQGKRAVELNPNMGDTYALLALSQNFAGNYNDAIDSMLKAMRLAPFYPPWFLDVLSQFYFMAGKYEEALEGFNRFLKKRPDALRPHIWIAAAYTALDQPEKAKAEAEQILKKQPAFSLEAFAKKYPYKNRADFDRMLAYAREAGLPDKPPLPLPDKPSIAVLPFVNLSGNPEQEYFVDGITNDIITALFEFKNLFVIASNSTFTYKGKPVKVQQVSKELGVRYVLEGSVQRTGDRMRINAQLIDATTGKHLWAERYDRGAEHLFDIQDENVETIVATLAFKVDATERERVMRKGPDNLDAYDHWLRGRNIWFRFTKEANAKAGSLFQKAIELDPDWGRPYGYMAWVHVNDLRFGWSENPKKTMELALKMAQKAYELNPDDYETHWTLGIVYLHRREFDLAIGEYERALALNSNDADFLAEMSLALIYLGQPEKSIAQLKKAMRMNPRHPSWYLGVLGDAYYHVGQYKEALATLKQDNNPFFTVHRTMAAVYVRLDRLDEARAAISEMLKINPYYTLQMEKNEPYKEAAQRDRLVNDLRKAGLK